MIWKIFVFIYWNLIYVKGELIRFVLGKKLCKGLRLICDILIYSFCDIYIVVVELIENLYLEDCFLLYFLLIVEGKFFFFILILLEFGFLIYFLLCL